MTEPALVKVEVRIGGWYGRAGEFIGRGRLIELDQDEAARLRQAGLVREPRSHEQKWRDTQRRLTRSKVRE